MPTPMLSQKELLRRWRREILARWDPATVAARRNFVATSILDQSRSNSNFVEIENVLVVLVYEEPAVAQANTGANWPPLRLTCYRVSRVPHGVQWGGSANAVLFKNLGLRPRRGGGGPRIDAGQGDLAALALKLNSRLSRAARYPAVPWQPITLPRVWAGFRCAKAAALCGAGPEFERACRQAGHSPTDVFRAAVRPFQGLQLFPIEWTDYALDDAVGIFVELTPSFRHRVFRVASILDGLVGFQGASAFDFYDSRFRATKRHGNTYRQSGQIGGIGCSATTSLDVDRQMLLPVGR